MDDKEQNAARAAMNTPASLCNKPANISPQVHAQIAGGRVATSQTCEPQVGSTVASVAIDAPSGVDTTSPTDTLREAFEAWALDNGLAVATTTPRMDAYYLLLNTERAWESWQAATAHERQRAAKLVEVLKGILPRGGMHYDHVRNALHEYGEGL